MKTSCFQSQTLCLLCLQFTCASKQGVRMTNSLITTKGNNNNSWTNSIGNNKFGEWNCFYSSLLLPSPPPLHLESCEKTPFMDNSCNHMSNSMMIEYPNRFLKDIYQERSNRLLYIQPMNFIDTAEQQIFYFLPSGNALDFVAWNINQYEK